MPGRAGGRAEGRQARGEAERQADRAKTDAGECEQGTARPASGLVGGWGRWSRCLLSRFVKVSQQNVYAAVWVRAHALAGINASAFAQTPSLPSLVDARTRFLSFPNERERERCLREKARTSEREQQHHIAT